MGASPGAIEVKPAAVARKLDDRVRALGETVAARGTESMVFRVVWLCLVLVLTPMVAMAGQRDWLQWEELPSLPEQAGGAGAYVGASNGALVVAGGVVTADALPNAEAQTMHDRIYVLAPSRSDGELKWRDAGRLPAGMAYGAAIATDRGLLCLGGRTSDGLSDAVLELAWDPDADVVHVEANYPSLPVACENLSAVRMGSHVYVAAGKADDGALSSFWMLDLAAGRDGTLSPQWTELPTWPGLPRSGAALAAQSDGQHDAIYLVGGRSRSGDLADAYRYEPRLGKWVRLSEMPHAMARVEATAAGNAYLLLFGRRSPINLDDGGDDEPPRGAMFEISAYNTITDTWATIGEAPQSVADGRVVPWRGRWVMVGNRPASDGLATEVWAATVPEVRRRFGIVNLAVLLLYLATLLGMGWFFARRGRTADDFFLGGRRIPWWAAGLSLMATQVSSIGFMAIPGKTFATDWLYFTGVATWIVVVPIVTLIFIPLFRKLNITSAYEYLEQRFNLAVRLLAAALFCCMQLVRIAIVLYLPALALSTVIGMDLWLCIGVMGLLATAYTVAGGMEAVVWTDVMQAAVLLGGAMLCIGIVLFGIEGGPAQFIEVAIADQKFRAVDARWDYTMPVLWVILVGNTATRLSDLTSDQSIVQRYLSTPDIRQAKMALWTNVAVSVPWAILIFMLGTALYVFYKLHPQSLNPNLDINGIVPLFIAEQVPMGISGLIIAAIFAAAMSSFDSAVHSVATVFTVDFYQRCVSRTSEQAGLWLARGVTALLGVLGTISALAIASSEVKSIWDLFMELLGLGLGVLAGLFLLGALSNRGNASGALTGAIASIAILYVTRYHTEASFFLYPAIGIASCWGIGYLASIGFSRENQRRPSSSHVAIDRSGL